MKFCHLLFEINLHLFRMMAASDEPDGEVVNGSGGVDSGGGVVVGGGDGGAAVVSPEDGKGAGDEDGQNGDEEQAKDDSGTNGKGERSSVPRVLYQFTILDQISSYFTPHFQDRHMSR